VADKDFVVKNGLVVNTSLIYANSSTGRVGIGNASPDATLTVTGSANVQGNVAVTLGTILSNTLLVQGASVVNNTLTVNGTANFTTANVGANVQVTTSQYFVGNSTSNTTVNSSVVAIGNSTVSATVNSTIYSGTANNVTYVGSITVANVVSNAQLSSNLASYALLSGGLFTGTVNATSHTVSTIGAANGFLANATTIAIGNNSSNTVIIGGSITTPIVITPQVNVGANVQLSTSNIAVINSNYSNITINSANIFIGNTTVSASINSTAYTGAANNATYFNGQSTSQVVNTSGNYSLSGNITFSANLVLSGASAQIVANGGVGTATQVLTSSGGAANVYWSSLPLSVNTSGGSGSLQFYNGSTLGSVAGLTFSTTSNTLSVINTISVGNSTVNATINSTSYTGTAANATLLAGVAVTSFVNTTGNFTISGQHTYSALTTFNGNFSVSNAISANGGVGTAGYVLTTAGASQNAFWAPAVNVAAQYAFTNTNSFAGTTTFNAPVTIANTLTANGVVGTATYLLTSGGAGQNVYWSAAPLSVNTSGGSGSIQYYNGSVLASCTALYFTGSGNNITVANTINANLAAITTAVNVGTISVSSNGVGITTTAVTIGNSSVNSTVNATSFTGTAANSTLLNNQFGSYYTNATNITTGTLPYAQLGSAVVNTSAAFTLSGNTTHNANVYFGSATQLIANGGAGTAGFALLSGGGTANVYWGVAGVNTAAQYTFSNTISHTGPTAFSNTISANSGVGTAGQALLSGGTGANVYWGAAGVDVTAQYAWTNTQTFSNTITFSTNGVFSSVIVTPGVGRANTSGIYPASNTVGMNFGNTIARWVITGNSASFSGSLGVGTTSSGTTGEIRATNEITAYYSSDINLKTNIAIIENALDKIDMLSGVMFDWKDEVIDTRGGEDGYFVRKHDTGIIAQEVEAVLPEVVATRQDGFKAVKYEKMVGLLIEGIKELRREIQDLKK
jgi:Chaperone of endosialidase